MPQTLLALCALTCALGLSLTARTATHHRTAASERGEVEVRLGQLGADLLDAADLLPFAPPAGAPAPDGTFGGATSLAGLDGLEARVDIPAGAAPLVARVTAEVDTVSKVGGVFEPVHVEAPFRRLRLVVRGALGAEVRLERIYTEP